MITLKTGKVKSYKEKKAIRPIAPAFVVAPPGAVTIKTRIYATDEQLEQTVDVGMYLGSEYRQDLAKLIQCQSSGFGDMRTVRKQELTGSTSSRWAGSITRQANDQYELAMRNLGAYVESLQVRIRAIEKRIVLPVRNAQPQGKPATLKRIPGGRTQGQTKPVEMKPFKVVSKAAGETKPGPKGYRNKRERAGARRKLGNLQANLVKAAAQLDAKRPSIAVGGKALMRKRNNLVAAKLTQEQWGRQWGAARLFLTADGDKGQHFGNGCIWVDPQGFVHIKIPQGLIQTFGKEEIVFATPVVFSYKGQELTERIVSGGAISYSISYNPENKRLYLSASWSTVPDHQMPLVEHLQSARHLGVDLNEDHVAAWVVDRHGNAVGSPLFVSMNLKDLPASKRDAYVRHVIITLIKLAHQNGCSVIAIENLDFTDARALGKEKFGKGVRAKKFRKTVLGIPTAQFRTRLVAMAYTAGLWIIAVDPAYTSKWGRQHWLAFLQAQQNVRKQNKASQAAVTGHTVAGVCVGRRSHGYTLRRKDRSPTFSREIDVGETGPRCRSVLSVVGLAMENKNPVWLTRDSGYKGKSNSPPL